MNRILGLCCITMYAVHVVACARQDCGAEALWACHVALLLLGGGWLARSRRVCGVAALWLIIGTPAWLIHVLMGGEIMVTSVLTHLGGIAMAGIAIRQGVLLAGTWWRAVVAVAGLVLLCRWVTPPEFNINAAYAPFHRFASILPYHSVYLATMACVGLSLCWTIERIVLGRYGPVPQSEGTS